MHIAVERDFYGAMPQNFGERLNIKAQLDAIGSKKVAERVKIERSQPYLDKQSLKAVLHSSRIRELGIARNNKSNNA